MAPRALADTNLTNFSSSFSFSFIALKNACPCRPHRARLAETPSSQGNNDASQKGWPSTSLKRHAGNTNPPDTTSLKAELRGGKSFRKCRGHQVFVASLNVQGSAEIWRLTPMQNFLKSILLFFFSCGSVY